MSSDTDRYTAHAAFPDRAVPNETETVVAHGLEFSRPIVQDAALVALRAIILENQRLLTLALAYVPPVEDRLRREIGAALLVRVNG